MELWKILKPCTCGYKKIWVVHNESFLNHKCYIECTSCNKKTKTFIRTKKAIEEWNNNNNNNM